jgi:hypothetical protein
VVKHVGRQVAGDREAEAAVIEVVDDVDRVRSKLPPDSERDSRSSSG